MGKKPQEALRGLPVMRGLPVIETIFKWTEYYNGIREVRMSIVDGIIDGFDYHGNGVHFDPKRTVQDINPENGFYDTPTQAVSAIKVKIEKNLEQEKVVLAYLIREIKKSEKYIKTQQNRIRDLDREVSPNDLSHNKEKA